VRKEKNTRYWRDVSKELEFYVSFKKLKRKEHITSKVELLFEMV